MKRGSVLLIFVILGIIATVVADQMFISKFVPKFKSLEKQRIVLSNKLATAKIVHENLNHVRDLVFKNMVFKGASDTLQHESLFLDFITESANDLKMKIVAFKTNRPIQKGLMTIYSYNLKLEGDFFTLGELCAKFENSRRIISIDEFDVSLVNQDDRFGQPKVSHIRPNKEILIELTIKAYKIKKV